MPEPWGVAVKYVTSFGGTSSAVIIIDTSAESALSEPVSMLYAVTTK
ncbi:MAG: hypothetical protein AAB630_01170 [Patescibacteria group bacterium]